jgi:hypothetical protein
MPNNAQKVTPNNSQSRARSLPAGGSPKPTRDQRLEAPRNAALLQASSAAGHWIGNHTWSHSVAFGDRPDAAYAREEIDRAQALIE